MVSFEIDSTELKKIFKKLYFDGMFRKFCFKIENGCLISIEKQRNHRTLRYFKYEGFDKTLNLPYIEIDTRKINFKRILNTLPNNYISHVKIDDKRLEIKCNKSLISLHLVNVNKDIEDESVFDFEDDKVLFNNHELKTYIVTSKKEFKNMKDFNFITLSLKNKEFFVTFSIDGSKEDLTIKPLFNLGYGKDVEATITFRFEYIKKCFNRYIHIYFEKNHILFAEYEPNMINGLLLPKVKK